MIAVPGAASTPSRDGRALSEDELLALLRREEQAAAAVQEGTLAALRRQALAYYDREPFGDEQEGASQVVTSEFADVVESLMPGLMRVFTAADDLVRFAPAAPGQERWAEEASAYVPHVLMRENDGFRILSALLKDALMYRLGGVAVDVETVEQRTVLPLAGLDSDLVAVVVAELQARGLDVELDAAPDPSEDAMPSGMSADAAAGPEEGIDSAAGGRLIVTRRTRRVVVENIAPEDIRVSPGARSEDDASFLGYIRRTTASELARLGLAAAEIDALAADRRSSTAQAWRDEGLFDEPRRDKGDSERPLWLVVAYLRADCDGDGISERLRVVYARGGGASEWPGRIVECTPWEGPAAIALATPILMPHTLVGRSLFDQTQDLQQLGTVLTRGLLDNLYLVNRPRPVVSDHVNIDSLIDWTPGSPIRLRAGARPGDAHVAWLQVPNVTAGALTALEHLATVRENRTGVSRYNQGLDADSLNKTLGGLDRILSASQQRQDLMARVFAETAIRRLYRLVYRAVRRAATGPRRYWRGSAFVDCDPGRWPEDMDLSVDVVGIGNREQALGHLALIGSLQEKLVALQGGRADGPFVTAANIASSAHRLAETLGYRTPGLFFQAPDRVAERTAVPAHGPTIDPAAQLAAAQLDILRARTAAEIRVKEQKARAEIAIARYKARHWAALQRRKAGLS
ncbi:MAG: portal protein [Pseudomonadota bacterium]